jgi:STE24 endopeptidase
VVILLKPVVLDPLFNKFTPMKDNETKAEIVAMSAKAGIEVGDVLVMDASRRTRHTNAYFTGFGSTKRIVLYDTLLETHTKPEVLSVIAHEIGHWKYAHIYKGFFMGIVGTVLLLLIVKFAGGWLVGRMPLGAETLASPATIPLVFLILFICGLAGAPVESGVSRWFERQADRTALELTDDGETFVQMQVKLARANASDPDPPAFFYYWYYSHPSTMERIAAAERYGD